MENCRYTAAVLSLTVWIVSPERERERERGRKAAWKRPTSTQLLPHLIWHQNQNGASVAFAEHILVTASL
jgi:hypothetical protein